MVAASRRRIARDNISRCLPSLSIKDQETLLRKNFEHYGILALELLHMFSPFPGHYIAYAHRNCVIENIENWRRANEKGKGILIVAAHIANWEMGLIRAALEGIPVTIVTRHLKPEWLHKKIEALRLKAGIVSSYESKRLGAVLGGLRHGKSIVFVLDQYAPPPAGIPIKFFTATVHTLGVLGLFSQRTGAPITTVHALRDEKGVMRVFLEPEVEISPELKDSVALTQFLSLKVEGWIRENPDQWLWGHRRFKNAVWSDRNGALKDDSTPL
jgi:KDO2-lipid IV(A) lauroyltransferase